jgi:Putative lysophospholipase.
LHAYSIKQNHYTSKWAIVVHGYGEEGKLMSLKALHFYEIGYNVLVLDLRGSGKSEGNYLEWVGMIDLTFVNG